MAVGGGGVPAVETRLKATRSELRSESLLRMFRVTWEEAPLKQTEPTYLTVFIMSLFREIVVVWGFPSPSCLFRLQ